MPLEPIYFILIVFSGPARIHSLQAFDWGDYRRMHRIPAKMSCASALEDSRFRNRIAGTLSPGQKATIQCRRDPEMKPLQFLLGPGAIQVDPRTDSN